MLKTMCLFCLSFSILAADLLVPSQFATISAAIAAASNGDRILVSPGTYNEQLFLDGKYVWIESTDGPDVTTINGSGAVRRAAIRVFNLVDNASFEAGISGFTITGGDNANAGHGGAFTIANNSPDFIIENNIIEGNHSDLNGGAILLSHNSHCIIRDNIIRNNTVGTMSNQFGSGAGLYIRESNPLITGNLITLNVAENPGQTGSLGASGGGIVLVQNAAPNIIDNEISFNQAEQVGGGIATVTGAAPIIQNNRIFGNTSAFSAGIHLEPGSGSGALIEGNQIYDNEATINPRFGGSGKGGGIGIWLNSQAIIRDNDIYDNLAEDGGGGIVAAEGSMPSIMGNRIYGNDTETNSGIASGGAIHLADTNATITNNLICDNRARRGGGILIGDQTTATLYNNTIVSNEATDAIAPGGGLIIGGQATATFINNITSQNQGFQILEIEPTTAFDSNLISNDDLGMYRSITPSLTITDAGSFDANPNVNAQNTVDGDPMFLTADLCDYRITPSSPAYNNGTSSGAPSQDMEGTSRPLDGFFDMGCFEVCPQQSNGQISGRVWGDLNTNDVFDSGEGLVLSVSLFADDNCDGSPDGLALQNLDSQPDGTYSFSNQWVGQPGQGLCYIVQIDDGALGNCFVLQGLNDLTAELECSAFQANNLDFQFDVTGFEAVLPQWPAVLSILDLIPMASCDP